MAWRLRYSNHLKARIILRGLPISLARDILLFSVERYSDTITRYFVAIGKGKYMNKTREFAVIYKENWDKRIIEVITMHPLKAGQKENRLKSGRWIVK